jgi:uncharacterized protein YukJ
MFRFTVKCSQKLNDASSSILFTEEYNSNSENDINDIIQQYASRAIEKNYVVSFTVNVEIKR